MGDLRISLFGGVRITHESWDRAEKLSRIPQLLLAYLLLDRRRFHSRDVLANLFWSEHSQKRARNCLNTALWRLRQVLEPGDLPNGTYLVTADSGDVGMNQDSDYWLDVAVFEERVDRVLKKPADMIQADDVTALESGIALYTGDLLESVYQDWALRAREHERLLYLNGLAFLAQYYRQQQNYPKSLEYGQRILVIDPLREEVYREMMRLYLESGKRTQAIRQYEECRKSLREELGIDPMEETQALYDQIITETGWNGYANGDPAENYQHAIRQLDQARQGLEQAMSVYNQAVTNLEKYMQGERSLDR